MRSGITSRYPGPLSDHVPSCLSTWWIDERQIENGQFSGGLSDDGDMTNQWPALALMGVEPEKIIDNVFYRVNNDFIDILGKRDTWGRDIVSHATPRRGSDLMRHVAWQVTGNTQFLEEYYADLIQTASQRMHMYTEDHWWVDRVTLDTTCLQRSRLGGIALIRSSLYPGHAVSWEFDAPAAGESVGILIPDATPTNMTILVYNIENAPVIAHMTAWDIEPGTWEVVEGIDTDGDNKPDAITRKQTIDLERTRKLDITFLPKKMSVIRLKLKSKAMPYWNRPDLGIGIDDISVQGNSVRVLVHSLGSVDAPASTIALLDASGKVLSTTPVPALKAPLDYTPETVETAISAPAGTTLRGCSVCIDPQGKMTEITKRNNIVKIP